MSSTAERSKINVRKIVSNHQVKRCFPISFFLFFLDDLLKLKSLVYFMALTPLCLGRNLISHMIVFFSLLGLCADTL